MCAYGLIILCQIAFAVRPAQAGQNLTPEILCEQISVRWGVNLKFVDNRKQKTQFKIPRILI